MLFFYSNLKFGHHRNEIGIQSSVNGTDMEITKRFLREILQILYYGLYIGDIRLEYMNFFDKIKGIWRKMEKLRPLARLVLQVLQLNIMPQTCSVDEVYPMHKLCIYAMLGSCEVNWVHLILNNIVGVRSEKRDLISPIETYSLKIFKHFEINLKNKQINTKTFSLVVDYTNL